MKILLGFLIIIAGISQLYSQQKQYIQLPASNTEVYTTNNAEFGVLNEKISFGLSLGFSTSLEALKIAEISPIKSTVVIRNAQRTNFVLSSLITLPITYKNKGYRYLNKNGVQVGQATKLANYSIFAVVNLVTLNSAENGNVFNQKLSGGIGVSYNLNENLAIGISYELNSYRKPKKKLIAAENTELIVNETAINSLDINDDRFFFDRYARTTSLKLIYKLTTK